MTQEERWQIRYQEVIDFIEKNHRNPSKHRIEEHDYLNWLKANRNDVRRPLSTRESSKFKGGGEDGSGYRLR